MKTNPAKPSKSTTTPPHLERLEAEPPKAFQMLQTFISLGLTRNLRAVAEHFGITLNHVQKLSSEYRWRERATHWETLMSQRRDLERLEAIRASEIKHARAANLCVERGLSALEKLNPNSLKPLELLRYLETGIRLEREALGLPGDIQGFVGPDGGPISLEVTPFEPALDYGKLTTEELEQLEELLTKAQRDPLPLPSSALN